jgi:hypothetical protein
MEASAQKIKTCEFDLSRRAPFKLGFDIEGAVDIGMNSFASARLEIKLSDC